MERLHSLLSFNEGLIHHYGEYSIIPIEPLLILKDRPILDLILGQLAASIQKLGDREVVIFNLDVVLGFMSAESVLERRKVNLGEKSKYTPQRLFHLDQRLVLFCQRFNIFELASRAFPQPTKSQRDHSPGQNLITPLNPVMHIFTCI